MFSIFIKLNLVKHLFAENIPTNSTQNMLGYKLMTKTDKEM